MATSGIRLDRYTLRHILVDRDMSHADLVNAAGIGKMTFSGIINGRSCSPATAQKIANALGVTVESLLEDKAQ